MPKFTFLPKLLEDPLAKESEEIMAARIAALRKQAKGLIQYEPSVETLAEQFEKGLITKEQIPKRLRKFIPGAAAVASIAGYEALKPEESEAFPLSKELRPALREAKKVGKTLYHMAWRPKGLIEKGMTTPKANFMRLETPEIFKPQGLFFAEDMKNLMWFQGHSEIPGTTKGYKRIHKEFKEHPNWFAGYEPSAIRGVLSKESKIYEVDEQKLLDEFISFAKNKYPKYRDDWHEYAMGALEPGEGNIPLKTIAAATQRWTDFLAKRYDAIRVLNVHEQGIPEVIVLNPKQVKLFHGEKKWPIIVGATAAGLGLAGEAEAETLKETVDVTIPPDKEEEAEKRLKWLMEKANLSEVDALKQLKWELEPQNRVTEETYGTTDPLQALTGLREKLATTSVDPQEALPSLRSKLIQEEQAEDVTGALSALRQKIQPVEVGEVEAPTPSEEKVPWWKFWEPSVTPEQLKMKEFIERVDPKLRAGEDVPLKEREEMPFWADMALMVASGAVGGWGTKTALKAAGLLPKLPRAAALAIEGMGAGATYTVSKSALGETPEGLLGLGPAEEVVEWGAYPFIPLGKAVKLVGKGTGKVLKGVELVVHKPFEKVAEPLRPAMDWMWDNVIIQPTNIQIPGIKKSVREMFQPAVERLAQSKKLKERMVASTFRKVEAMKSLTTDVGRALSREMESLLPSEQYEVLKGLRGTPVKELKSQKAKDLLSRFEGRIHESNLNFLYENKFREELSKGLTKSIENIEESVTPASISRFLKLFEAKLPQKVRITDIHNMMEEIIAHPRVSDEMKTFIKDMWSTPARTPIAVADAARKASTLYLTEKLISNKGIVSAVPKENYVLSKWGKFNKMYVPRDVELQLQDISKIPRIARGVYQKWFLTPWKVSKTIVRPAYHLRNLVSNAILNDWGGLPFYRADVYMKALKGIRNNSQAWVKFRQLTGAGGTFVQQDIYQLGAGLEYGASMWDKMYSVFERTAKPGSGLMMAEENLFKFAKYLHNVEELGMKPAEAALDAMKWCFNYGEVTTSTAYLRKYGMPFATWYTKSIPLMAETAFKHPLRFWKWVAFGMALQSYAMEQVGVSDSEWETIEKTLPNYIQKGIYLTMPWRDDQGRLNLLNMTYILPGIGDINELYNQAEQGLQVPNPLVSILAALGSRRKFSGAPLYHEWESPGTKWMKAMTYVWEQMSPAVVPGGTDWNLMWRAVTEQEGAPTPEQALGSWFGFKLTPIDPMREARRHDAIRKIHESEINLQMQRELRETTSAEEQQEILRKYQVIREGVSNP